MKKIAFLLSIVIFLFSPAPSHFIEADGIWEDFEGELVWTPVNWENVREAKLSLSEDISSSGAKSLRVDIKNEEERWRNKVAFYRTENLDLRDSTMILDVYLPGDRKVAMAIGFDTGDNWTYFESPKRKLKKGWNKDITFELSRIKFKGRESDWKYEIPLREAEDTRRVFILIYKVLRLEDETVYIDNIRFSFGQPLVRFNLIKEAYAETITPAKILKVTQDKNNVGQYEKLEIDVKLKADYENPFNPNQINLYINFAAI